MDNGKIHLHITADVDHVCDSLRDLANYLEECNEQITDTALLFGCQGDHYVCDFKQI